MLLRAGFGDRGRLVAATGAHLDRLIDARAAGAAPASSDTEVVHAARMVEHEVLVVLTTTHNAAWVLRQSNRVTDRS